MDMERLAHGLFEKPASHTIAIREADEGRPIPWFNDRSLVLVVVAQRRLHRV